MGEGCGWEGSGCGVWVEVLLGVGWGLVVGWMNE